MRDEQPRSLGTGDGKQCRGPLGGTGRLALGKSSRCRGAAAAVNVVVDDGLFSGLWAFSCRPRRPHRPLPRDATGVSREGFAICCRHGPGGTRRMAQAWAPTNAIIPSLNCAAAPNPTPEVACPGLVQAPMLPRPKSSSSAGPACPQSNYLPPPYVNPPSPPTLTLPLPLCTVFCFS